MSKKIRDNFDVRIKQPIDSRFKCNNLNEIDRPYEGLITLQLSDGVRYEYKNNSWIVYETLKNVKNYGAKGDGTNQTVQFQNTINSTPNGTHQMIHIPIGTYIIDSLNVGTRTIQWVLEQGASITGTLPCSVIEPNKGLLLTLPKQSDSGSGWSFEVRRTNEPLNYKAGSKAVMVIQDKDESNLGDGESAPGVQFDFKSTGNGFVNSATRYSNSVWQGVTATQDKHGDASGHCFTALGQLNAVGTGGYNELGLYQGMCTNLGSVNGGMSGVEVLMSDGIGTGAGQSFDTSMNAVIGRVKRYNAGAREVHAFFASSEGTVSASSVLAINKNAPNGWNKGIDFSGTPFNSGIALLMANNNFIACEKTTGSVANILGVDGGNQTVLMAPSIASGISLLAYGGAPWLVLDNDANDPLVLKIGGQLKRVTVGAVDSGGTGYRMVRVLN